MNQCFTFTNMQRTGIPRCSITCLKCDLPKLTAIQLSLHSTESLKHITVIYVKHLFDNPPMSTKCYEMLLKISSNVNIDQQYNHMNTPTQAYESHAYTYT